MIEENLECHRLPLDTNNKIDRLGRSHCFHLNRQYDEVIFCPTYRHLLGQNKCYLVEVGRVMAFTFFSFNLTPALSCSLQCTTAAMLASSVTSPDVNCKPWNPSG